MFAPALDGKQIITVEHLSDAGGMPHPVQRAMVKQHASQCVFRTPGFVTSLFALHHADDPRPVTKRGVSSIITQSIGLPVARDSASVPASPGSPHAFIGPSPHAHAKIPRADATPDVAAEITAADLPDVSDVRPTLPGDPVFAPLAAHILQV
jgi:hypothetical protein